MGLEALLDGMHSHGSARDNALSPWAMWGDVPSGLNAEYFPGGPVALLDRIIAADQNDQGSPKKIAKGPGKPEPFFTQ